MGSKSSKLRDNIETVLRTSDAKSKWILGWYLEDRFRDQFGTLWGEVQNSPIVTIFDSWKFGRRIGLASLSQILSDITPILVLSVDPQLQLMSVILSLILNEISFHEKVSNHKLFSNEIHGIQLIEMKAFIILFLDDVKRRRKISQKDLGVQLKIIATKGLNFSHYPSLVDQFSLTLWSHWALIHILTKLCSVSLGYLDIADILKTSVQYCSDFSEHLKVLRLNRKDSLLLQFSESGFICPDDKGVRQPCEGAFIRVVETDPKKWSSKDHQFDGASLAYDGVSEFNYQKGLIHLPQYKSAWDCRLHGFYRCHGPFQCIKCSFVDLLIEDLFGRTQKVFEKFSDFSGAQQMLEGVDSFSVLQATRII